MQSESTQKKTVLMTSQFVKLVTMTTNKLKGAMCDEFEGIMLQGDRIKK